VGRVVGFFVGKVGTFVGDRVGLGVGILVGYGVGGLVGDNVGVPVGVPDGGIVGLVVGVDDGRKVGSCVGVGDGIVVRVTVGGHERHRVDLVVLVEPIQLSNALWIEAITLGSKQLRAWKPPDAVFHLPLHEELSPHAPTNVWPEVFSISHSSSSSCVAALTFSLLWISRHASNINASCWESDCSYAL